MRTFAAVFVAMHGLGHLVWLFVALTPVVLGKQGRAMVEERRRALLVDPSTAGGKLVGVLAITVIGGFLASAWGIWFESSWWPVTLIPSAVASLVIVTAMWNPIKAPGPVTLSVRALLADVGLAAATLMPWGERLLGAR